jgi:hypothetical protein
MFRPRNLLLGLLTAGCLSLGTPASGQETPKKSADIVVHSVKVHTTKKSGDAWDALGGAPDLMVSIRKTEKGGAKHTTKVKRDTFDASFGERTIRVSVGDEIEVIVYDEDEKFHDKVGEKTVKITEEMLKKREVKWELGRVISLVLEFEP